ncbi:hypothetical protein [Paracoccus sp. (in: a-proteobacteria)]|uniref:hypothetical protein n=1 Tax=Paracoccus sp. TaxID=267 RepID=UPI00396CCC93
MRFGIGATMTAAFRVIMLSAFKDRAGMAAPVQEVSFELGGALGITILGEVMTALYTRAMVFPAGLDATVADSFDEALLAAEALSESGVAQLTALARGTFDESFVGVIALAAVLVMGERSAPGVRLQQTIERRAAEVSTTKDPQRFRRGYL